jgi:hypothetical protein
MDCLARLDDLTKELEVVLGPDTAELSMRFGKWNYLHTNLHLHLRL